MQIATLFRVCSIAGIMALSSANHIQAQSSRQISYQGVVTQGDTKISDGWYSLTFALYGSVGSSTPLWQEEQRVYFGHGLFNVMLGAVHPLPEHLPDDAWIGISFQGSGEFTRTKLTAVPFALQAEFAANAMRAEKAAELEGGVVTGINGIQGNVLMKASDGLEIRTDEDGGLIVRLSNEKRYEGILNQGTEWLLAGNSNANANSWLGTSNNFPLIIRTNNAERMRILSSNGNIGIGTISPAERVHIAGNAQIDGNVIIKPTSNTTGELRIYEPNSTTGTFPATGIFYTAFKAQAQDSNYTYTLPASAPVSNGQVLTASTGGTMSWATKSLKITVNNFDPDAVNAASFANFTVTANGVTTNDVVSLHRVGGFGDLIIASAYVNTNNQVTIRVYNPTASSVNLGAETLIIGIIRE